MVSRSTTAGPLGFTMPHREESSPPAALATVEVVGFALFAAGGGCSREAAVLASAGALAVGTEGAGVGLGGGAGVLLEVGGAEEEGAAAAPLRPLCAAPLPGKAAPAAVAGEGPLSSAAAAAAAADGGGGISICAERGATGAAEEAPVLFFLLTAEAEAVPGNEGSGCCCCC